MADQKNVKEVDLGSGSVGKLLFSLALPAISAQVINVLYNMVDRMYIGHLPDVGANALTGVGVTFPIIMAISAFAALVSMGRRSQGLHYAGQRPQGRGRKDPRKLHHGSDRGVPGSDRGHPDLRPKNSLNLRRQRRHHRIRLELHADLLHRHHLRPAGPRLKRVHQRPGVRPNRYADRAHRRGVQHYPGPHSDVRAAHGRPGSSPGPPSFPRESARPLWSRSWYPARAI